MAFPRNLRAQVKMRVDKQKYIDDSQRRGNAAKFIYKPVRLDSHAATPYFRPLHECLCMTELKRSTWSFRLPKA